MALEETHFDTSWKFLRLEGSLAQRWSLKLPVNWRLRFKLKSPGTSGFQMGSRGTTNLMLLTEHFKNTNRNDAIELDRVLVVDRDGSEFESGYDAITVRYLERNLQGWRLKAFPRRDKRVRLRFIYHDADWNFYKAADFEVKNPAYGKYPEWKAEPMPSSKTDGAVALTLVDFVTGLNREKEVKPVNLWYWKDRFSTQIVFDLKAAELWQLDKVTLRDPTGNVWAPNLEDPMGVPKGKMAAEFIGALWPSEPVWKIDVSLTNANNQTVGFEFVAAPRRVPMSRTIGEGESAGKHSSQ